MCSAKYSEATNATLQGLQAPTLGQIYSFDIVKQPFLQILLDGKGHWILISTLGTKDAEVHVYCSIYQSVKVKETNCIPTLHTGKGD